MCGGPTRGRRTSQRRDRPRSGAAPEPTSLPVRASRPHSTSISHPSRRPLPANPLVLASSGSFASSSGDNRPACPTTATASRSDHGPDSAQPPRAAAARTRRARSGPSRPWPRRQQVGPGRSTSSSTITSPPRRVHTWRSSAAEDRVHPTADPRCPLTGALSGSWPPVHPPQPRPASSAAPHTRPRSPPQSPTRTGSPDPQGGPLRRHGLVERRRRLGVRRTLIGRVAARHGLTSGRVVDLPSPCDRVIPRLAALLLREPLLLLAGRVFATILLNAWTSDPIRASSIMRPGRRGPMTLAAWPLLTSGRTSQAWPCRCHAGPRSRTAPGSPVTTRTHRAGTPHGPDASPPPTQASGSSVGCPAGPRPPAASSGHARHPGTGSACSWNPSRRCCCQVRFPI